MGFPAKPSVSGDTSHQPRHPRAPTPASSHTRTRRRARRNDEYYRGMVRRLPAGLLYQPEIALRGIATAPGEAR
jgi:hypothetical protein